MKKLIIYSLLFCCTQLAGAQKPWKAISYETDSKTFPIEQRVSVFKGCLNSILEYAPELKNLSGIQTEGKSKQAQTILLKLNQSGTLLVASPQKEYVDKLNPGKGSILPTPFLQNGLRVTELPALQIYGISYKKGEHQLSIPAECAGKVILLGMATCQAPKQARDVQLADATEYLSFFTEGYSEGPALFKVIGGQQDPVVEEGMPGTEGIQGGFEGGQCIKLNGVYHMFPTERAGDSEHGPEFDRIKTRIGHWTSKDAIHWQRESTLYQSSGTYAVSHEDNPMNDRRAAIWSYMPIFNEKKNRWQGHYLAYTCDKEVAPNHSFGRIWRCESTVEGIDGIGGPYKDCTIVIEPGLDSQLWEGRQGVASFFPFKTEKGWYGFYSGAFPYAKKSDYPYNGGRGWYIGLATADDLEGPWTRMGEDVNPIVSIHPEFVENPIVSKLTDDLYIAIFDGGPATHSLPNMMAYTLSRDGLHWSEAHYIPFDPIMKKWWDTMRTPLCLIPEGNDEYTVIYAAVVNGKRFHPMGMVKLKLDRKALEEIKKSL